MTTGGRGPADDAATWEPLLAQVPQPRTGQDWADWLRSTAQLHGENGSVTLPEIWQALTWMARREGFAVEREYCGHGDGVTAWHRRAIRVRPGIGGVPAVTALTHELAHILLHRPVRDVPGASTAGCRGIQHLQAVSVAFVVCSRLGVDTTGCSFPYVASWAGGDPRARPGTAIRHAAAHIMDAAETIGSHLGEMLPALGARPAAAVRDQESALLPPPPPHRQPLPAAPPPPPVPASVHRVLGDALRFYVARRDGSWVPGYLTGRGVGGAAARRWEIGYAPGGWTALTSHLRGLGHHDSALEAAGLARRSRRGTLIDFFRDRVIFAVRDEHGAIAGFTGRARPGTQSGGPKYLNSPQTAGYRKGELLFGLHQVRDDLAAGAVPVIAEGPFDAIAVSLAGEGRYAGVAPAAPP